MLKNVQEELNRFAKYVIQQSRTNLTKGKSPYGSKNNDPKLRKVQPGFAAMQESSTSSIN